jgi:hypothetical protein
VYTALALVCAGTVAVSGELSPGALLAVVAAGIVVSAVSLSRRAGKAAPPVGRRGRPWAALLSAAVAWELGTLAHEGLPTLSDLADPALAHPALRGTATACWLAAGAWLAARPGRPRRPG